MFKKFFRTSAQILGIAVCMVCASIGAAQVSPDGVHLEAFEIEWGQNQCRNVLHDIQRITTPNHIAYGAGTQSVEIGHSYGPGGRTTHYENRPRDIVIPIADKYICMKCNQSHWGGSIETPRIEILNDGVRKIIRLYEGVGSVEICPMLPASDKPHLAHLKKLSGRWWDNVKGQTLVNATKNVISSAEWADWKSIHGEWTEERFVSKYQVSKIYFNCVIS